MVSFLFLTISAMLLPGSVQVALLFGLAVPTAAYLAFDSRTSITAEVLQVELTLSAQSHRYRYRGRDGAPDRWVQRPATCSAAEGPDAGDLVAPVLLPQDQPVALMITSDDQIWSWSVPGIGAGDAIPGFVNEVQLTVATSGRYAPDCAPEGDARAGPVEVVSLADFERWLATQPTTPKP